MPSKEVLIPQMGEGLTEVRILAFLKQPGERVERDEPLYSMETDKATMEVESPVAGVLEAWLSEEGAVLPIGSPIARIETHVGAPEVSVPPANEETPAPPVGLSQAIGESPAAAAAFENVAEVGGARIPPRTRLHAKKLGVDEAALGRIPARGATLLPEDVDRWLAQKQPAAAQPGTTPAGAYREYALSSQQRAFVFRMRRSAEVVIAGTIRRPVDWSPLQQAVQQQRAQKADFRPTEFQTFAYLVAKVVQEQPRFRSTLVGDETVREWEHANLGIAVARENDELVTATVKNADTLAYPEFIRTAQENIRNAREGEDQADASVQLLLTYMGAYEVADAVPVLVAPAVAVLFIGSVTPQEGRPMVNLGLTFDHRLINGVQAARFLQAIAEQLPHISQIL